MKKPEENRIGFWSKNFLLMTLGKPVKGSYNWVWETIKVPILSTTLIGTIFQWSILLIVEFIRCLLSRVCCAIKLVTCVRDEKVIGGLETW